MVRGEKIRHASLGMSPCSSARLCDIEQTDEQELVPTESPRRHKGVARPINRHQTRRLVFGWVPERSIGHAWKACVPQGTEGSNPSPSATSRLTRWPPES
jgi:hypothetical protein